jgi:hypothetical protein
VVEKRGVPAGAQVVGQSLTALAIRSRHLLGLVDADQDRCIRSISCGAQGPALGFKRGFKYGKSVGCQFAFVGALGLRPSTHQPIADDTMSFDYIEVSERLRQRLGEIQQRIGTWPECA